MTGIRASSPFHGVWRALFVGVAILALALPALAYKVKEPIKSNLDALAFSRPEMRVPQTTVMADDIPSLIPNMKALDLFRAENGAAWYFLMDQRLGRVNLLDGGAIPFIPGAANTLRGTDFGASCDNASCIPVGKVEALAREFLSKYQDAFQIDPNDLELDPLGSLSVGNSLYFLRFQWKYAGIPVEGGSVFFRINNGNLLQVATDKIGPINLDPTPTISAITAWDIVKGYLGKDASDSDQILNPGSLFIVPITPKGINPDTFGGGFGTQVGYALVYKVSFTRPGVIGTWEATVDAHSGELLRFVDSNRYGHIHGGIRPSDGIPPEENRPFPWADTGLAAPNNYSDNAGNFPGNSATSTLVGKYAHIADACGAISNATTTGDMDFRTDNLAGTDCVVPPSNPAGLGNTHSSRTLYYNLTAINLKAQIYNPSNTWLTSNFIIANVNGGAWCNATSGGGAVNFYQHVAGSCNNLGEIPGVAMHEWAHSYDTNDGSGGQTPPLETYADWTAIIQTHNSCTGAGFLIGANCGGYGDACTGCSGVRDCDYAMHANNTPWTSANHTTGTPAPPTTIWGCSSGSYDGPCGWEDHCESGISTQALWDFIDDDLTDPCPAGPMCNGGFTPLDVTTAWMLEDRLWFAGVITNTASYTCSGGVTDGCSGTVLYSVMRALDDDGDGTANGTPHAHAIWHAMSRHLIHCSTWNDTSPQNQNQTSCPALTTPVLSAVAGNNQAILNWTTGGANATRYFVYRNESSCDVAFTRIAVVTAPTLTYTDNGVVNGTAYYYRVQAATANDSCVSPSSNCIIVTPQPCAGSITLDKPLYNCADTVNVSVLDSTPGTAPWTVTAWSTTDATVKTITLTNNPPGSATYTGTFTTTTGAAGATQVQVANGATITVRYTDKDYCGTPNQNVDKTVLVDCAGPVISNVLVTSITDSSAIITWTTSESANSRVTYGLSTPPGTNQDDLTNYVTNHSVMVSGLTGCTPYYFSVTSADVAGNSTTDNNAGIYYSFTTYGRAFVMGPDNVEGTVLSWVASGTAGALWHQDTCKSNSPTHAWKAGAVQGTCPGAYVNSATTDLTWSANINLGAAGHGYHLLWREWYATESGYDYCYPQISVNGGGAWTDLMTRYSGTSGGWITKDIDLAAYTGSTVWIRFHFTTDGSETAEGWYVDDIHISKSQSCTAEMAYQSNTYTDSCASGGAGNADTYIDPGETITVHPTLKNTGSSTGTGISATLSTLTAGITINNATATYPDLTAGASAACNAPHFTYTVGSGVACGTVINFTLTITSASAGPWTQTFTNTVGHYVAGTPVTSFTESFDAATFPPTGWTSTQVSGTTGAWARVTTSTNPTGIAPHSGAGMAEFNSYHATSGNSTRLARTANISIPAGSLVASAVLWVYHETGYTTNADRIQIQTSPDGTTWTDRGTAVNRYDGSTGWKQHTIDLSALIGAGNFRIGYHGISAYGNDTYLDDVSVTYTPGTCTVVACVGSCTAPGAPTLNSATGACTGVNLAWTAGTGTTNSYNVYRFAGACGGAYTKLGGMPVTGLTYSDTTAVAGTSYAYVVRGACDAGGTIESVNSNCLTATRTAVPAAPTGVSATAGCTGNSIAWTNAPTATSHNVLRGTTCGTVVTTFTGVTTPYNDTTAVAGTTYNYWVVGINTCGTGANSSCATAARLAVPAAPAIPTFTAITDTALTVNWTAVSGATTYDVWRAAGGACAGAVKLTGTPIAGTTYPDSGLVCNTAYSYYITANNTCGTSANGTCGPVTTAACGAVPPEVGPGTTPATSQGWTNKTTATWPSEATATSYTLYRGMKADLLNLCSSTTDSCTKYAGAGTSTATIIEDPTGIAGGFYWYLVTGTNGSGEGTAGVGQCSPRVVNSTGVCP